MFAQVNHEDDGDQKYGVYIYTGILKIMECIIYVGILKIQDPELAMIIVNLN